MVFSLRMCSFPLTWALDGDRRLIRSDPDQMTLVDVSSVALTFMQGYRFLWSMAVSYLCSLLSPYDEMVYLGLWLLC